MTPSVVSFQILSLGDQSRARAVCFLLHGPGYLATKFAPCWMILANLIQTRALPTNIAMCCCCCCCAAKQACEYLMQGKLRGCTQLCSLQSHCHEYLSVCPNTTRVGLHKNCPLNRIVLTLGCPRYCQSANISDTWESCGVVATVY